MSQHIIIVNGPTCAGKTTLVRALRKIFDTKSISLSYLLRQHATVEGLSTTEFAEKIRAVEPDAAIKLIFPKILQKFGNNDVLLIESVYSPQDIDALNKMLTENKKDIVVHVAYINADFFLRVKRMMEREAIPLRQALLKVGISDLGRTKLGMLNVNYEHHFDNITHKDMNDILIHIKKRIGKVRK